MVEQEYLSATPVFCPSEKETMKLQEDCINDLIISNSAVLLNERSKCTSILHPDVVDKDIASSLEYYPEESLFFDDKSNIGDQILSINANSGEDLKEPSVDVFSSVSDSIFEANSPLSFWGTCPLDLDTMKIDDVFQVDKDDLVQSPTLAELNANDESLFDSFDCFESFLSTESKTSITKSLGLSDINSDCKVSVLNNTGHTKKIPPDNFLAESRNNVAKKKNEDSFQKENSQESFEMDQKDTCQEIASQVKPAFENDREGRKTCMISQVKSELASIKSSESDAFKDELGNESNMDTDDDSDLDGDYSSDEDEESEEEIKVSSLKSESSGIANKEKRRSRYFWQYNMQSKGPKGPKMKIARKSKSAHEVSGVADPVFSANCSVIGVKHSGKARKGDGNDLTPNPKKLYNIGVELEKLTSVIDGLVPVHEQPVNVRTKSRKEKNKLASRACRLKKKAQHEANKLKLFGLQQEQKHLLIYINEIKKMIKHKVSHPRQSKEKSLLTSIQALKTKKPLTKVGGCSADFVNGVLKVVASGDENGGLNVAAVHEN